MKRKRIVSIALAVVLVATLGVMFVACCPTTDNENNASLPLVVADVRQVGNIKLSAAVDNATDTTTLTVTVLPESAVDKTVDWSLLWDTHKCSQTDCCAKSPVSNYVQLTPTSDGANTATVKVLKKFWVTAVVTVKSCADEDVWATCKLQYAARYNENVVSLYEEDSSKYDVRFVDPNSDDDWALSTLDDFDPQNISKAKSLYNTILDMQLLSTGCEYKVGTIRATNIKVRVVLDYISEDFYAELRSNGFSPKEGQILLEKTITQNADEGNILVFKQLFDSLTGCDFMPSNASDEDIVANINKFNTALATNTDSFDFGISFFISSDYQQEIELATYFRFARTASCFTVSSIQFDEANLVF